MKFVLIEINVFFIFNKIYAIVILEGGNLIIEWF